MALSIAGQGAVVVCPTHCDRTACVALTHGPGPQRLLATYLPWDKKCQEIRAALPPGASDDEVLVADDAGTPSVIRSGSVSFTLLRRNGRLALRVRDSQSPVRTSFPGIELFAYDPMRVVDARVIEPEPGATVAITNVTGFVEEQPVAAELEFTLAGESARFVATAGSDGRLFVVFGDASNGRETYGAGRFLDIAAPVGGCTTIDFNRATNPPCSFTAFATCPLPPPQNRLPCPVLAGERAVARGH